MEKRQFIRLLVIFFCLYLMVTTIQAIIDMGKAGNKLTDREKKLELLKKEQEELLAKKSKTSKPNFWEKVARDQLGLAKPGEEIIVIPPELLIDLTPVATPDATPNWKKWKKLLF